jgi:predicted nucleotidyltransferase
MVTRDHELEKIVRVFLDEIQKRYHLDSAYIFGSYAKGT